MINGFFWQQVYRRGDVEPLPDANTEVWKVEVQKGPSYLTKL